MARELILLRRRERRISIKSEKGQKARRSPKASTTEKSSCSESEGTRFYFRKTEGETRFKYMSRCYMENAKGKNKRCDGNRNTGPVSQEVRLSGAVHWWYFEMEVKSLSCKIKEIGMRCFLILYFQILKHLFL